MKKTAAITLTALTILALVQAALVVGSTRAFAGDAKKNEGAGADRIKRYIAELGHKEYKVRSEATKQLIAIGKSVILHLESALKSKDPEVAWRARKIVKAIEDKGKPKSRPQVRNPQGIAPFQQRLQQLFRGWRFNFNVPPGARNRVFVLRNINGKRVFTIEENGRSYRFEERKGGAIEVTEKFRKGKEQVTRKVLAKNAAELKKNHPDLHKLYEQHAGRRQPLAFGRGQPPFRFFWGGQQGGDLRKMLEKLLQESLKRLQQDDGFKRMRKDLEKQFGMKIPKFENFDFDKMRKMFDKDFGKNFKGLGLDRMRKLIERFRARRGAPGRAPRPRRAKAPGPALYLGITPGRMEEALRNQLGLRPGTGVLLERVAAGSVAARASLLRWDVLLEVNGATIGTLDDLRKVYEPLSAGAKVTIKVYRRGKSLTLSAIR